MPGSRAAGTRAIPPSTTGPTWTVQDYRRLTMVVTQDPRYGTNRWGAGADPWPARVGWNALLDLITTKAAIFIEGTFAARPAFSAAKKGTFYWATDLQRLYYQSATAWTEVSP